MDKKEKILDYINGQPWAKAFFDYQKRYGRDFNKMILDRYLICLMDWESMPGRQSWLKIAVDFAKWYDEQNFED